MMEKAAASDADEDVAWALVMAHYQWGTSPNLGGAQAALDGNAAANRQSFAGVVLTGVAVLAASVSRGGSMS